MANTRFPLRALAIVVILAAVAFAASAPVSNQPSLTASDPVIRTVLQPDLTLHSTFLPGALLQAPHVTDPQIYHVCRESCGVPCSTDADCSDYGGVCEWETVITCD
jgi:hypothetical protein